MNVRAHSGHRRSLVLSVVILSRKIIREALCVLTFSRSVQAALPELRTSHDQVIDEVTVDVRRDARAVVDVERVRSVVLAR